MAYLPRSSETEQIVAIQFGVFSPEEILKRAVCEVTSPSTTDGKKGGLFDARMGVLDNKKICESCGQNNHKCPGHFGYFKLARPLYLTQFFKTTMKVVRCICYKCGKLLIDKTRCEKVLKLKGESRWKEVLEMASKITRCGEDIEDGCGARQPSKYREETVHRIIAEFKGLEQLPGMEMPEGTQNGILSVPLEPEQVYRLLRRITDEDAEFMGFSRHWCRPDWMMTQVLPIPPPQVRPSVTQDNNQKSEDDLTSQLICIIKTNVTLKKKIAENEPRKKAIDEWTNLLQYYVATLVDNNIPGVSPSAQRSGRLLKSLQQRLGSKEGRIRSNLQGKRVEFSARSVITPDPNISVKELGIPEKIATNITFPEKVTAFNIGKMYKLIRNGPDKWPGAKTILRATGRTVNLKHVSTETVELFEGDTVNRHLMDGDPVLFNRQPSLHRMSMMCHIAKILPYNTFRLNVFVTAPYNADFDGDEMNLHAPQSIEAATELRMIAAVPLQIVSPGESIPIVSVVQDTLVGSNRFARPNILFTRKEAMNLLMHAKRWNGILPEAIKTEPQPMWSGQQLMSLLLPPVSLIMDKGESKEVRIEHGIIKKGILNKAVFSKQLLHIIYNDYGPDVTVDFLDSLQTMIAKFLMNSGFSVGISDLIADEGTLNEIYDKLAKITKTIEDQLLQLHSGLFENSSGRSNSEEIEAKLMGTLNKAVGEAGGVGLESLADTNRMTSMIKAGSKGSDVNVSQMIATLGQQAIDGKRIPNGFQHRTLPHFKRFDDSAEARGFIGSSYVKGLLPHEFYFHAMAGREGLIDTAVKSVTGDTPVVVMEKGVTKCVPIGDWIDAQLDGEAKPRVERFEERDMELLHLEEPVYIPTTDAKGIVTWGEITAITRHDPGLQLYEIVTSAGKRVIVTESKSLLIWDPETSTFERMSTPDVKPGHYVPVTLRLPEPPIERSNTSDYAQGFADSALLRESCDAKIQTALVASLGKSSDYIAGFLVLIDSKNPAIVDAKNMLYSRLSITPKCYAGLQQQNDVVLDKIVEINLIDVAKYPKVYDLTVPSTLNFGLANGLHVVDTADTGYMQRQIRVALEDMITQHDGSVRDAMGNIVQVAYGEDGINATKLELQPLPLANLTDEQIRTEYAAPGALGAEAYLQEAFEDRRILVECVFRGKIQGSVRYPVHIHRLIESLRYSMRLKMNDAPMPFMGEAAVVQAPAGGPIVTASEVLATHARILHTTHKKNRLWGVLVRYHLRPVILAKLGFTKVALDALAEQITLKHWQSWVEPGQPVGVIAAQSIGQPATQMTLNTFHLAGVAAKSNMTRGVPRLKELMKATHNPKAVELTIPLRKDLRGKKEEARRVSQLLEFTMLQDIVTVARIYYDPRDVTTIVQEDADWLAYMAAFELVQEPSDAPKSPWILRFELDRDRMFAKNITMDDVAFLLKSKFGDIDSVYTDYNATRLVFRARLVKADNAIDDLNVLKALQNKILSTTVVRGIPGLRTVNYQKVETLVEYDPAQGKYDKVTQYVLSSDGSNIADVMANANVDATRVVSSNVHDMYEALGIEATRATFYKEITTLFEESGSTVNYRHVCLLVDAMCHKGKTMSIDRYGINKNNIGPLAKMSFEQTEDIALRAATFGERDPVLGVSAKIMLGAPIRAGTAFSEILFDEEAGIQLATSTPDQLVQPASGPQAYTEEQEQALMYGRDDTGECSIDEVRLQVAVPDHGGNVEEEADVDVEISIV